MRLQDYDTSQRLKAMVVASKQISPSSSPAEVREILIDVEQPGFAAAPGQSIGVLAPGRKEFGQDYQLRLYTIADVPVKRSDGHLRFPICVRRCSYLDKFSGERYEGVASNYLCDLRAGDSLTVTGPYGLAFEIPEDPAANLILIGAGTGIAPFRAYVKHLYREVPEFEGRILLFHGGQTGLDLLYMNEELNDFAQYYDRETFKAVSVLSQRPHWSDTIDWSGAIESRAEEIWKLLSDAHTCVYLAGLEAIRENLDAVFAKIAGGDDEWAAQKAELQADHRWIELLY